MKHGSFKVFCIVILAFVVVLPGFSDDANVSLESVILEAFNGDSQYTWRTDASKFATRTNEVSFPRLTYVESWPIQVFGRNPGGNFIRSLGINGRFDRRGHNWIDVYPTLDGSDEPHEILIPGRPRSLDMWVWGANHNFTLEAYVRDYRGIVHILNLGSLHHRGWRNLHARIPSHIPQARRTLPSHAHLHFVKFRIWTQPTERVDDFFVYFKNLKILTDMFETYFDGDDLANPDFVREVWADSN